MSRYTLVIFFFIFSILSLNAQNSQTELDSTLLLDKESNSFQNTARQDFMISGLFPSYYIEDLEFEKNEKRIINNTDAPRSLQAKAAGLSINANSYTPGASSLILMRGFRSFRNSNQPSIFLNGLPINNSEWNNVLNGTDQSNRFMDIDPNAIESVQLLKSMAGRAKYGMLGGNGILSIRTKRAHRKNKRIHFKSSYSIEEISNTPDLQETYAQGRANNYRGPENNEQFSWGPLLSELGYDGDSNYPYDKNGKLSTDNLSSPANFYNPLDFFQSGSLNNNSLEFSGGLNKMFYNAILSTHKHKGVIPTNQYTRYNFSSSIDLPISSSFDLHINGSLSKSVTNRTQTGSNLEGIMLGLLRTPPSFDNSNGVDDPVQDITAYELEPDLQRNFYVYDNPYWSVNKNKHQEDLNRQIINLFGRYKISKKLSAQFSGGLDRYKDKRVGGKDRDVDNGSSGNLGTAYERELVFNSNYLDLSSTYKFLESNDLQIVSTLGFQYHQSQFDYIFQEGTELISSNNVSIDNVNSLEEYNSLFDFKRTGGIFSSDLSYKNFLKLTGSFRHDLSNKFGEDAKGLSSYGLGASLSVTDMLQSNSTEPKQNTLGLVLHGSYGRFGNDFLQGNEVGSYVAAVINGDGFVSSPPVIGPETNPLSLDTRFSAERINAFDLGLQVFAFNKKLNIDIQYYQENSKDLAVLRPVASSTGSRQLLTNGGSILNKGLDLNLAAEVLETKLFGWTAHLAFNKNVNTVKSIGDFNSDIRIGGFTNSNVAAIPEHPFSSIYGRAFLRNEDGVMIINEDGYPFIDPDDKIIGNPNPDWTMYLNNTLKIGANLSISGTIDIKQGGELWCGTCGVLDYLGRTQRAADERGQEIVFEGVNENGIPNTKMVELTPENSTNQYYRIRYGFGGITEMSIYDASWIRLRHIAVQYDLTKILKIKALHKLSVQVFAENIFLQTDYPGIDPETNLTGNNNGIGLDYFNNPGTKKYGLALSASF